LKAINAKVAITAPVAATLTILWRSNVIIRLDSSANTGEKSVQGGPKFPTNQSCQFSSTFNIEQFKWRESNPADCSKETNT
jgi:hypothetical protein